MDFLLAVAFVALVAMAFAFVAPFLLTMVYETVALLADRIRYKNWRKEK